MRVKELGEGRPRPQNVEKYPDNVDFATCECRSCKEARKDPHNMIDHPSHYQSEAGIEVIDVIEAFGLGYRLGNVVKYVLRAGAKGDREEDLKKARWYLEREISK